MDKAVITSIAKRYQPLDAAIQAGWIKLPDAIHRYAWVKDSSLGVLGISNPGALENTPASFDDDQSSIIFTITNSDEDRDGDVVVPLGVELKNFRLNPVWFFGHQEWVIPIGTSRSEDNRLCIYPEENRVRAACFFDMPDPDAAFIHGKCRRGILNATSIAFVPIEARRRDIHEKAESRNHPNTPPGWLFERTDLTEISIVGVPSNAGAIRDALDSEKSFISPRLQKSLRPYAAVAKGKCFSGWCPTCPPCGEEKSFKKRLHEECHRLGIKALKDYRDKQMIPKPKIVAKGGDYKIEEMDGKWWVLWKGRKLGGPFNSEREAQDAQSRVIEANKLGSKKDASNLHTSTNLSKTQWLAVVDEILQHTKGKDHTAFPNADIDKLFAEHANPRQAAMAIAVASKKSYFARKGATMAPAKPNKKKWVNPTKSITVNGVKYKSTSSDVRSPTETSTSTEAYTADNFTTTVTGGAGDGDTVVNIYLAEDTDEMDQRKVAIKDAEEKLKTMEGEGASSSELAELRREIADLKDPKKPLVGTSSVGLRKNVKSRSRSSHYFARPDMTTAKKKTTKHQCNGCKTGKPCPKCKGKKELAGIDDQNTEIITTDTTQEPEAVTGPVKCPGCEFVTADSSMRFCPYCGMGLAAEQKAMDEGSGAEGGYVAEGTEEKASSDWGDLHDYNTGSYIRAATQAEYKASISAGAEGVIKVNGKDCYVEGGPAKSLKKDTNMKKKTKRAVRKEETYTDDAHNSHTGADSNEAQDETPKEQTPIPAGAKFLAKAHQHLKSLDDWAEGELPNHEEEVKSHYSSHHKTLKDLVQSHEDAFAERYPDHDMAKALGEEEEVPPEEEEEKANEGLEGEAGEVAEGEIPPDTAEEQPEEEAETEGEEGVPEEEEEKEGDDGTEDSTDEILERYKKSAKTKGMGARCHKGHFPIVKEAGQHMYDLATQANDLPGHHKAGLMYHSDKMGDLCKELEGMVDEEEKDELNHDPDDASQDNALRGEEPKAAKKVVTKAKATAVPEKVEKAFSSLMKRFSSLEALTGGSNN